ncbi:hypothetical protein [Streptomyces anulatus]|uniref:hypothetical protein n=1 Tax=Streptomyces anulatus TaxID=1892 RepID=UPI00363E0834
MTRHDPVEADRIVAHRDPVGHDVNYLKKQEKIPNPTPPAPGGQLREGPVTHMGEIRQLVWISAGLAGICSR